MMLFDVLMTKLETMGFPRSAQKSFFICLFYGTMSISLSLLNKALLSSYNFSCYFLLLSAQLIFSITALTISRDYFNNPLSIPKFNKDICKSAIPMSFLYIMNVTVGMIGLQLVSVPLFSCIRRTSSAFILLYEFLFLGKRAPSTTVGSVGLVVLGTLVAGSASLSTEIIGYIVTCINNMFTAASSVKQKEYSDKHNFKGPLSTFTILYYQAICSLPICITIAILTGEFQEFMVFPYFSDIGFQISIVLASLMGLVLSYASLLCTTFNSPLATSITGNMKDIGLTIIGAIMFPGFEANFPTITGILLSFLGSGLYSYFSFQNATKAVSLPSSSDTQKSVVAILPKDPSSSLDYKTDLLNIAYEDSSTSDNISMLSSHSDSVRNRVN